MYKRIIVIGVLGMFLLTSVTILSVEVANTTEYEHQLNVRYITDFLQHNSIQKPIGLISTQSGSTKCSSGISNSSASGDNTLIASYDSVFEIDYDGNIVWQKTGLNDAWDAERLSNGNTLIADGLGNRTIEIDYGGNIVWQKTGLNLPMDAERLNNGNTLIAEVWGDRVIEVDYNGNIVWQITIDAPIDVERLDNGNTLIVDVGNERVIEVKNNGNIVWQKTGLPYTFDAERLDNGNTLIADSANFRVIEVDYNGNIVWQFTTLLGILWDVERLDNGNTLIADLEILYEVDQDGNIVWIQGDDVALDAERISNAPSAPMIDGPAGGKPGIPYIFSFNSIDPNGDQVSYYIDWGDSTSTGWFGPFLSGVTQTKSHTWSVQGTYIVQAKAKDTSGGESSWSTLVVNMPRNRESYNSLLLRFLERYPLLNLLLQRLRI